MISIIGLVNLQGFIQMDDDNLEIPPISMERNKSSISLSVNREAFQEFVVSLLGKPDSVDGYVEGAFEIDFGGFEQLHQIIDDRITKQNQSLLTQFTAKLFFNDNSSFSFSSINSFQEYKERRNLICTGFIFTWVYLVEFRDKKAPEKQEISVSSEEKWYYFFGGAKPTISYSVKCTNKVWGIEIARLIRNCTIGFIKTNVPLAGFRRKAIENSGVVIIFSFILVFSLSFVFLWIYSQGRLTSCRSFSDQIGQFVGGSIPLGEKVDFLINFFNACQETTFKDDTIVLFFVLIFFLPSFILSLLISALILWLIKLPTYRFLLFTEASKKEREKYFTRISIISWWRNFLLITVGVGAFLNRILWNYISEWWSNIFG
ncbi:MAG: hypothetical protein F6K48_27685 [Okeania sp. SIO3H1]|nr:hypothetical protein [Okeania sp. SIO3H1]